MRALDRLQRWWTIATRCKRGKHDEASAPYLTSVFVWYYCRHCGKNLHYHKR